MEEVNLFLLFLVVDFSSGRENEASRIVRSKMVRRTTRKMLQKGFQ